MAAMVAPGASTIVCVHLTSIYITPKTAGHKYLQRAAGTFDFRKG